MGSIMRIHIPLFVGCLVAIVTPCRAADTAPKAMNTLLVGLGSGGGSPVSGLAGFFSLQTEKPTGKGLFLDSASLHTVQLFGGSSVDIVAVGIQQTQHAGKSFSGVGYGLGQLTRSEQTPVSGGFLFQAYDTVHHHEVGGYIKVFTGRQAGALLFHATVFAMLGAHAQGAGATVGVGFRL